MKKLTFSFLFSLIIIVQAQAQVLLTDISGMPYVERTVSDLGGSPYFNDQFLKGAITLEDNSVFKDILLRYDLESGQLVYKKSSTSGAMIPNGKVVGFTIEQTNGEKANFKGIGKGSDDLVGFYQILLEGNNTLLKKVKKKIVERVEYNTPSKTKTMSTITNYYIQNPNGEVELVKADKKSFIKVFGRESEINDFISKQNINLKNESDMVKLVTYINSIEKSI